MREGNYVDAGMDMKKLGICFIRECWLVFVAAALGAVIGAVVYMIVRTVPESEREYQAMSKIYLDFASDETGEAYQAYNGYTWNDLMVTDPFLDVTMGYLSQDYTREEVAAATKAEILSDIRLLTVTITTHDADRCNAIMQATGKSLVQRGDTAKEFINIEVIQCTEAELVTADDRTIQAALVGLGIAVALTLFGMLFYYIMDDRIFVAGDLRNVTDASFVGYAGADRWLGKDYDDNLSYLREKVGTVSIFSVTQKTWKADSAGRGQEGEDTQETPRTDSAGQEQSAVTQEKWKELCAADGVVVMVEYGRVHASYLAYMLEQLRLRECRIAGIGIAGADNKFLNRYYGHAVGRGQA
ncbi:MAG: hypothetical protein NC416_04085 [Eubacterium sp.]|nr:hypothetical protein [Eubacterium sp.]